MLLDHFGGKCERIDPQLKTMLVGLQNKNMGHGGKKYWAQGAVEFGVEEMERGLWFHGR